VSSAWTSWWSPRAAFARGRRAAQHLDAGARKVIISAPAKGSQPAYATVVLGVNFDEVHDPDAHEADQALDGNDAPAAHHDPGAAHTP
jgi:hypothetical protein